MSTDAVRMSQWPSDQEYVIPVAPGPDVVTVTIDGKEVQVPRGELLRVAEGERDRHPHHLPDLRGRGAQAGLGVDPPRRDRVHADAEGGELRRQ